MHYLENSRCGTRKRVFYITKIMHIFCIKFQNSLTGTKKEIKTTHFQFLKGKDASVSFFIMKIPKHSQKHPRALCPAWIQQLWTIYHPCFIHPPPIFFSLRWNVLKQISAVMSRCLKYFSNVCFLQVRTTHTHTLPHTGQ